MLVAHDAKVSLQEHLVLPELLTLLTPRNRALHLVNHGLQTFEGLSVFNPTNYVGSWGFEPSNMDTVQVENTVMFLLWSLWFACVGRIPQGWRRGALRVVEPPPRP